MKASVCKVCGFIPLDGVPEKCPVCGAPRTAFVEKDGALKTSQDIATYGESEKKHVPAITVSKKCGLVGGDCVDAAVKIGEITHPMLPEHFITRIDFYLDRKYIARVMLTPEKLNPAAVLHLKVSSGTVTAIETCNLHGSWMNETAI